MTTKSNKDKDDYYVDKGYEIVGGTDIRDYHEYEEKMNEAVSEAANETGVTVVVKPESNENKLKNGTQVELPSRIAFQEQKVSLSRLPIWYLNAIGSLTPTELVEFKSKYADSISVNEIICMELLEKSMAGDKEATTTFWNIQQKMLQKTNIQNQINITSNRGEEGGIRSLLDVISNNIKEANLDDNGDSSPATGNCENTPTP